MIRIAIAEDSDLLREAIAELVLKNGFEILARAKNGLELIDHLSGCTPDIVLMDISMPEMDGIQTTAWLKENRPEIKVIALTMMTDDKTVMQMLKSGARAFLMKHTGSESLFKAINDVFHSGYYFNPVMETGMRHIIEGNAAKPVGVLHDEKDLQLIQLLSTSLTYREIGERLHLSPRTVENKQADLIRKLQVKGRIELALYAVKHGIIEI